MAYLTYLISTSEDDIKEHLSKLNKLEKFRMGLFHFFHRIKAKSFIAVTHFYCSYGTSIKELNKIYSNSVDGGKVLHKRYWHPFRPPLLIHSSEVHVLSKILTQTLNQFEQRYPTLDDEYFKAEIEKLHLFYKDASEKNHAVISFLEKPHDTKRARKVMYPIKIKVKTIRYK